MPKLFDSYIIVDWSAAAKPTTGSDSIWIAALTPDARFQLKTITINPDTRFKAVDQLVAALSRLTKRGDRVFVGFDFPMGYPTGTANALKLAGRTGAPWKAMHEFLVAEVKDKADNSNNRFALAARMNRIISDGPFPFWGCPKKDEIATLTVKRNRDHGSEDVPEFRIAEERAVQNKKGRPQSVWKLAYAGAVGSQAMIGIPTVHRIIERLDVTACIWPFQTGWFEDDLEEWPQVVFGEIYPSILPVTPKKQQVKDEAQVITFAEWCASEDKKGRLSTRFARPNELSDEQNHQILSEEGWILGI